MPDTVNYAEQWTTGDAVVYPEQWGEGGQPKAPPLRGPASRALPLTGPPLRGPALRGG